MPYVPKYSFRGTTPSGVVYTLQVPLTREVACIMDRIACAHPHRYDPNHWLDLYYEALRLAE